MVYQAGSDEQQGDHTARNGGTGGGEREMGFPQLRAFGCWISSAQLSSYTASRSVQMGLHRLLEAT